MARDMDSHSCMWHRRRHPHRLKDINPNDDGIFTAAKWNEEGGVPCHRPQRFSGRESAKLSVWVLGFGSPEHPSHRTQLHTIQYARQVEGVPIVTGSVPSREDDPPVPARGRGEGWAPTVGRPTGWVM